MKTEKNKSQTQNEMIDEASKCKTEVEFKIDSPETYCNAVIIKMKTDAEFMDELKSIVDGPHNFLSNLTRAKKFEDLRQWILQKTQFIPDDGFYTLATRIFYILNNLNELPTCANPSCSNKVKINFTVYTPKQKYYNCHCCGRCVQLDPHVKQKIETTNIQRYGIRRGNIKSDTVEKRKHTCRERFGADSPLESQKIRDKCKTTLREHYGVEYPGQSEEIRNKIHETVKHRYKVDCVFQSKEIQEKITNTLLKKYDATCTMDIPSARQKMHDTMYQRYGSSSFLGTETCKEKTKKFFNENYGVNHPSQVHEIRLKIEQTNIKRYNHRCGKTFNSNDVRNTMLIRYGVTHNSQSPEIRHNMVRHYQYDGQMFDSKPELAYYIWLSDVKVPFVYQPEEWFEFEYRGIKHRYFPDFKVYDRFFEIKGEQFFKVDDTGKETMINPYRNPEWSDEEYSRECEKYEAKHQCMILNNVTILRKNDYIVFVDYVKTRYGTNFLDSFKLKNNIQV